jgi:hypothetical protein
LNNDNQKEKQNFDEQSINLGQITPQIGQPPRFGENLDNRSNFMNINKSVNPYHDDFNHSFNKGSSVPNKVYSNEENATPKPLDHEDINQNFSSSQNFNERSSHTNYVNTDVLFLKQQLGNQPDDRSFPRANNSAFYNNEQQSSVDDLFPMPKNSNINNDFPLPKK